MTGRKTALAAALALLAPLAAQAENTDRPAAEAPPPAEAKPAEAAPAAPATPPAPAKAPPVTWEAGGWLSTVSGAIVNLTGRWRAGLEYTRYQTHGVDGHTSRADQVELSTLLAL
jgi:hypothetical protein